MITQFEIDRALMAGAAYFSTSAGINRIPIPQGWTERIEFRVSGDSSGFEARAFQKGNEIVIAYAGTTPSDLSGDMAANFGLATGAGSVQLQQAAEYYLQVQAANSTATISFAGHSLGGGLAALMGVFFGKQALTFDQAPFANSAEASLILPDVAANLQSYLVAQLNLDGTRKYNDMALQGLTDFLAIRAASPMGEIPNDSLVNSINVRGEFLSGAPWNIQDRIGIPSYIPTNAPGVSGFDLHSQTLLTAFLQSMQTATSGHALNDVTFKLTNLMEMIFDDNLYAYLTTDAENRNFLERLVQNEQGNAMVTRFTSDLWKLAQDGGLTMADDSFAAVKLVSQTLIAFAMEKYYTETQTSAGYNQELFTGVTGGVQFDLADVAANVTDTKGYNLYFHTYVANSFSPSDRDRIYDLLRGSRDWYVQAGRNGMEATDTQNRGAFMLGGLGADMLTGGSGNDLLVGNAGHDRLTGGAGTDTLMGGQGFDRYYYMTDDGHDRIEDSDARGMIVVNGQMLVGGVKKANHTYWESADGSIRYEMSGTDLVVNLNGTTILTVNEDFQSGEFGIRLVEEGPFGEATRTEFLKFDHYEQVGTDPLTGDPIYEPVYTPFFDDTANDTRNYSLGGGLVAGALTQEIDDRNNLIYARGGNDFILSGAGDDQLYGEEGHDWIYGGLGNDRLFGGLGTDQLFGDNVAVSTSGGQDYLDGGEGDDFVGGGAGRDILFGGAGNDLLNGDEFAGDNSGGFDDWLDGGTGDDDLQGGAGSDVLIGGADNDFLLGDRTQYQDGTPEAGGNDVLDSGAGNDQLFGVYGNDVLIGGTGNDLLNGQDGNDVLDGGAGDDWLSGDLRLKTTGSWGTLGNSYVYDTDEYRTAGGDDVLFGEEGNDIIIGGEGSDTLDGGDGNDSLFGGYNTRVLSTSDPLYWTLFAAIGADRLDAGAGSDMVVGGIGHDTLMGGEGQDTLRGGGGDDVLEGGADNDVLYGEYAPGEFENNPYRAKIAALAGNNQLDGGAGNDELYGGDLADILVGGAGNDRLNGGSGVDILLGESGDDRILDDDSTSETVGESETLDGGDGNDYLESWWGDDILLGGRGDDVLLSRAGTDSLTGGEGNDYLIWDNITSTGTQSLYGGLGNDVYEIVKADAVVMEMAGEGIDLVITNEIGYVLPDTIENFMGSGFGNALGNVMMGWDLEGREGNDTLIGNGRLDGGVGDDLLQSGPAGFSGYNPENGTAAPPGIMSSLLQPTPHPKPTEPYWYLEKYYLNTAFAGYNNTYVFGVGYGHDTIDEMDRTFTSPFYQNEDTVEFLSGVAPSDIAWERIGNDLELSINGGADRLTIQSFYDLAFYRGNHNFSGLWVPPEGYEFEPWGYDVTSYPTYKAYSRVERFTFADGTVWTSDHFGAPQLGDYQADTYQFGRGSRAASVLDFDFLSKNNSEIYIDTIRIGAGVTPADIGVYKNGNDLILAIEGTDDYCTVQSFFSSVTIAPPFGYSYYALPYQIEQVQFDDGTVWTVGDLYGRLNTSSDRFSTIIGTANADSLSGDSRDNVIYGLEGNDSLYGLGGSDTLYGGPGNDYMQGTGGHYFEGGPGDDYILGYDGGNTYVFRRGDGQDRIGTVGLNGAADTLIVADLLPTDITVQQEQFLAGDRFVLTSNLSFTVNGSTDLVLLGNWVEWRDSDRPYNPEFEMELIQFADGTIWTTADLIAHAQGVTRVGSDGDESFYGSVFNDVLRGQGGQDSLSGRKGNDLLDGGAGEDYLDGGFGSDTYVFGVGSGTDWIWEDLYWYPNWGVPKPTDVDVIQLGAEVTPESVALHADLNNNLVLTIVGTTDELTIFNYWGDENREIEQIVFADGTVWDSAAIRAHAIGMEIAGTEGDDILTGTLRSDVLMGVGGADVLDGAEGNDLLIGGAGHDTYVFNLGDGVDTIEDIPAVGEGNQIHFGAGIGHSDLTVTRDEIARTLTIQVGSSGTDRVRLLNFDPTGVNGSLVVETLRFADGSTMALADLFPSNQAPTVATPLADQTVPEAAPVSIQVPAAMFVDAGDVLTYSASLADGTALPSWLSFDPLTRTFIGMPDDVQVGSLDLRVTATDRGNLTASDVFTLTVTNVNEAPTVATPLADQNILEDAAFSLAVPASTFADVDQIHGEVLTYSATLAEGTALPTWLSFDPLTRTFSGTPVNSDVGVLNVAVTATDSGNLSTSDTFSLTVQNINDAPTVAAPFADQMGAEDEPFSFTMPASTFVDQDAILGDSLTYRATLADGSPLPAWLSFNPLTRTFSGTPIPGSAGTVQLAVTATDTGTLSVSDQFALVLSGPLPKTFIGTAGNDVLIGARGDDTLLGLGGNDVLSGGDGHDWLDGGIGDDTMQGGMGDDTYVVDNSGDVVIELANEGIDTVRTSLTSYTLGANVENLTLTGGGTSLGVGNALNNTLLGDAGTNVLSGGGGDDVLIGGAGTDVLDGGAGADMLIGGIGSDMLVGGTGNDRYRFSRGDGQDVIRDKDTTAGNNDRLAFGATINPLDLVIERKANDLRLRIHGAGEDVLIDSWYSAGTTNRVETIEAGNGQTLLSTQVDQLIQAMALFSQQTGLTWDQAIDQRPQDVQTVLAANGWQ